MNLFTYVVFAALSTTLFGLTATEYLAGQKNAPWQRVTRYILLAVLAGASWPVVLALAGCVLAYYSAVGAGKYLAWEGRNAYRVLRGNRPEVEALPSPEEGPYRAPAKRCSECGSLGHSATPKGETGNGRTQAKAKATARRL